MQAAQMVDDVCINVIEVDSLDALDNLIDGTGARIGARFVAGNWVMPPGHLATLDDLKVGKIEQINQQWFEANNSEFEYAGHRFSRDAISRDNINGMAQYVALNRALPQSFEGFWKTADNNWVAIPDTDAFIALHAAMIETGGYNFKKAQGLKKRVERVQAASELTDIDWHNQ